MLAALHANGKNVWERDEPVVDALGKNGAGVLQVAKTRVGELDRVHRIAIQVGNYGAQGISVVGQTAIAPGDVGGRRWQRGHGGAIFGGDVAAAGANHDRVGDCVTSRL